MDNEKWDSIIKRLQRVNGGLLHASAKIDEAYSRLLAVQQGKIKERNIARVLRHAKKQFDENKKQLDNLEPECTRRIPLSQVERAKRYAPEFTKLYEELATKKYRVEEEFAIDKLTERKKIVEVPAPENLLSAAYKVGTSPTLRNAEKLWEISERLLREEGLWPRIPLLPSRSLLEYSQVGKLITSVEYQRDGNMLIDGIVINTLEPDSKRNRTVSIGRSRLLGWNGGLTKLLTRNLII